MMKSIKIGDEITTAILNSVQKTITANLLTEGDPNFAACKAVASRLSNYVAACEKHYEVVKAAQPLNEVDALKSQLAEMAAKLEELTKPKATPKPKPKAAAKPKATTKPKATEPKATPKDKLATETGYATKGGRRLAAKAGQGRKQKNVVLEAQQQISFVSALPTV
jgi:hypothetical protein